MLSLISTIFKTINSSVDETRKTLALFNKDWNTYKTNWQKGFASNGFAGGVKSVFQSTKSVVSPEQIQMLRTWNNAVKHGCTNQETFNKIIANADHNTKMYFAGLNKGKGTLDGLKKAQNATKASTIGLTIAQTALNMAISMGLMAAISLAIKGFDKMINHAKRASEAADEAFEETSSKVQEQQEELKTLDELISKYKELKKDGTLDIEGRKEVKELQNDIADLVGTQARNLDLVNGKLDDEIKKLDEISAKEAKNAYETATANYNNSQRANQNATGDDSFLFVDGYAYTGKREKDAEKILKEYGFGNNVQSGGFFGNTLFVMDTFDNDMNMLEGAQEKADYLQSMIDVLEQNGQRATELYSGLISQRDKYLNYIDNQQGAANTLVSSWITYSQYSNEELSKITVDSVESFEIYRQKMIEAAKNDESVGKLLSDGTLSEKDLEVAVNDFMATSIEFSDWYKQWIGDVQGSTFDNKMTVSIGDLKSASDGLKTLGTAFKEMSDDGHISLDTLADIKTTFADSVDDIDSYIDRLMKAKAGSQDFTSALTDLTYGYINQKLSTEQLANADETYIATLLKEVGVSNSVQVAQHMIAVAKEKLRLETEGVSLSTADEINDLMNEEGASNATKQAIVDLARQKVELNMTKLDFSSDLTELDKVIQKLGVGTKAYATFQKVKALQDMVGPLSPDQQKMVDDFFSGNFDFDWDSSTTSGYQPKTYYTPKSSGSKGSSSGSSSGSYKNEALDKYLKDAEKRYKVHQDEIKYIEELDYALNKLVKTDEERLEILDKIEDARKDYADNRIKDLEHQIELQEKLNGENANVLEYYDKIQSIASEEADRLRGIGYDDNSNEIQELQNKWWDTQNKKLDFYSKQHENIIRDIEHARDMATENNPYADITSYYQQLKDEYHKEAERLRALDPEKYKEEIQELQLAWWEAHDAIVDWRWNNSQNWISDRKTYNDWALFDDSEVDAWERVVKWLKEEYPNDLEKIKEAEQSLFEARKKEFDKANNFGNTYIESQKTLLQSYFDVTNSIAEARHEINKELETSKTMYEWLDEETRQLLFNQEDYNKLNAELNRIDGERLRLQADYKDKLDNATLETIESITSEYEMQYEMLMKSYEIAKADLEIAKKKAKLNNVLNERNVRMFINGQWQWVANTEDVINAKSELADAEYAKRVEQAGLTQQQSINNLTKQQDELGVVIKKFENGVIDLETAVRLAKDAIGSMPNALSSMYSKSETSSYYSSSSSIGSSGGSSYTPNPSKEYVSWAKSQMAANSTAWHTADASGKKALEKANQSLGSAIGSTYDSASGTWKHKHADGTRYTPGGLTLMGEEGIEAYISSNGHLIPINQPTIGNIGSGGVVFNADQMKNLRSLWDLSNLNFGNSSFTNNIQPQQVSHTQDNRIIINGLTVDNGSSDGQALVSALRRYIGNH